MTELLPLEGYKSVAWNHFGFSAKDGRFVESEGDLSCTLLLIVYADKQLHCNIVIIIIIITIVIICSLLIMI